MYDEAIYAFRSIRSGAAGYVMKSESSEHILEALRTVIAGEVYLSANATQSVLSRMTGNSNSAETLTKTLTDRELEVFTLLGQAKGTREIAKELHLSMTTIASHRAQIKTKLHLRDAKELLQRALQSSETRIAA